VPSLVWVTGYRRPNTLYFCSYLAWHDWLQISSMWILVRRLTGYHIKDSFQRWEAWPWGSHSAPSLNRESRYLFSKCHSEQLLHVLGKAIDPTINQNLWIALATPVEITRFSFPSIPWDYHPCDGHLGLFKTQLAVSVRIRSEVILLGVKLKLATLSVHKFIVKKSCWFDALSRKQSHMTNCIPC
jgi:hypothetical protein